MEWHNYYRSRLLTRDAWSQSTLTFFNNTIFKATSTSDGGLIADRIELDDWELEYQNAFEGGFEAPAASNASTSRPETPASRPPTPSSVPGASISGAMGGLTLDSEQVPPPPPPPPLHQVVEDSNPAAVLGMNNKGKVRGTKGKQKGRAAAVDEVGVGAGAAGCSDSERALLSRARKTRSGNKA